ncbi:MAG: phosphoenolpyruvate--protein phosphotransferase [Magnetovibrio sp.]|nr:phosphoenolpyruvate--protein phosphotransferase [Magnetovibrio sp.]
MVSTGPGQGQGTPISVSRRLLARIRDVMAGADTAAERLDQVVRIIAADMVAEVCSIYVRRGADVLELFATQGLKPSAVHQTKLKFGEGIVGDVAQKARAFALADAQEHPNFAYRPETGEEIYHSMMGVPVLRGGRVAGVIAVQNRTRRHYTEEEIETMQTVAMVMAELIASGELFDAAADAAEAAAAALPLRLEGLMMNEGLGVGEAVLHVPDFHIEQLVADDPESERRRLHAAFADMHGSLDELLADDALAESGEHRDVLETYRLIAEDAGWLARIEDAIRTGLTAEAAVQRVRNDIRARMANATDPYLRERVHDLDDLAHRLLIHLVGGQTVTAVKEIPDRAIVVARNMGPAQFLDYDHEKLAGLVLEEGSPTSHVAIIARALDVPVVGHVRDVLTQLADGDTVVVDADNAQIFARPGADVLTTFEEGVRKLAEQKTRFASLIDEPAVTADGAAVSLNINAGLMIDLKSLADWNADGVGLFRTEVPFMARSKLLGVDEQTRFYAQVLDQAGGKPVIFRTLDIGGDKVLPHWGGADGENPAMGWRAIRVSLDRPALLRQQLRALIRAAAGRRLHVMFPMIAEVSEFVAARDLVEMELAREKAKGRGVPDVLKLGVMLEVPSLAFQLPALLGEIDFLSVGSNDLGQFLFAQDRGDPRLAGRYDMLSPAVLKFLSGIVEACDARRVPVGLCGEMAGRPLEAMALLGVGFRRLSMAPASLGPVKAMVRSLHVRALEAEIEGLFDRPDHAVRDQLRGFAADHGVEI